MIPEVMQVFGGFLFQIKFFTFIHEMDYRRIFICLYRGFVFIIRNRNCLTDIILFIIFCFLLLVTFIIAHYGTE